MNLIKRLIVVTGVITALMVSPAFAVDWTNPEENTMHGVNQERIQRGRQPYDRMGAIRECVRENSRRMRDEDRLFMSQWAKNCIAGATPENDLYNWNLCWTTANAAWCVDAWMNGHERDNILSGDYTKQAAGAVWGGNKLWVTHVVWDGF